MSALTDEDLAAIEARASTTEPFVFDRALPSCDHPERGHAPQCHNCRRAELEEEITTRKATFATHGRHDVLRLVAEVERLKQEVTYADRAMREHHARFASLHADVSLLGRELGVLGEGEYAPADRAALFDFIGRVQNEVENLRTAQSIARFRSVIDDFLAAPEMFARDPECGAHVVYGAMREAGGNGRTWYDACLAVGLARGNVAVAAETWDDVRRLATHLHETAETWAVRL